MDSTKQIGSKKWADMSSESSDDENQPFKENRSHHTKENGKEASIAATKQSEAKQAKSQHPDRQATIIRNAQQQAKEKQLERLNLVKNNTVWLQISATSGNSEFLKQKIFELREERKSNKQIISMYPSKSKDNVSDLKVDVDLAKRWIKEGLDKEGKLIIEVAQRNFQSYKSNNQNQKSYNNSYSQSNKQKFQQKKSYIPKNNYTEKQSKYQPKYETKYQQKKTANDYVQKKTKYELKKFDDQKVVEKPKFVEKTFEKEKKSERTNKTKNNKYVSKDVKVAEAEQKVNRMLEAKREKTDNRKVTDKKMKKSKSNFYGSNHYAFSDSDD